MSGTTWAVVVNWNGGEANLDCIASLLAEGLAERHLVLVDNASVDSSPELIVANHPDLVLLRNERNEGFGLGANRGILHALEQGAARVLLVNNDAVLSEGCLALLEEALDEDQGVGMVAPRICLRSDPQTLWCAGGILSFRQNLTTLIGFMQPDGPAWKETVDVDYVTGCVLLGGREVFEQVGVFADGYFAYHEDVELGVRAREAGFRSVVVGEALALHAAHSSTGGGYNPRRKYMMGVNTVWFLRSHGNARRWLSFFVFDVASLPLLWCYRSLQGEGAAVRAKARGIWDGLRGLRVTEESLRLF